MRQLTKPNLTSLHTTCTCRPRDCRQLPFKTAYQHGSPLSREQFVLSLTIAAYLNTAIAKLGQLDELLSRGDVD